MKTDDLIDFLDQEDEVAEFYVLVRELKLFLDVGHEDFHPSIRVKIYRTLAGVAEMYSFDVSHHVHGPEQAGPYYPSNTTESSEEGAISRAIDTTTSFIKSAINAGHQPSNRWLVPNEFF